MRLLRLALRVLAVAALLSATACATQRQGQAEPREPGCVVAPDEGALLDEYEAWMNRMPEAQRDGPTGDLLTELLDLRELVDQLAAATLPKGFGRD